MPLARIAAQVAAGKTLDEIGFVAEPRVNGFFVEELVLPFDKLEGTPIRLGPEMRTTGEVMGHASSFGHAFAKAQMAAGGRVPSDGTVFLSRQRFRQRRDRQARARFSATWFSSGRHARHSQVADENRLERDTDQQRVRRLADGVDVITRGDIQLIVNAPLGRQAYSDGEAIRRAANRYRIPLITTLSVAAASIGAIRALQTQDLRVKSLQTHHRA